MSAKKAIIEIHKFGGASLGDGAAFRHAVTIVQGRRAAPVVVVSAPAGITDVLLGLATRAVAGDSGGRAALERDVAELRRRYHAIARAAVGGAIARAAVGGPGGKTPQRDKHGQVVMAEIDRSLDELASLLASLAALKELTPRIELSREGYRLVATADGLQALADDIAVLRPREVVIPASSRRR